MGGPVWGLDPILRRGSRVPGAVGERDAAAQRFSAAARHLRTPELVSPSRRREAGAALSLHGPFRRPAPDAADRDLKRRGSRLRDRFTDGFEAPGLRPSIEV